jgi:hypothetical protein
MRSINRIKNMGFIFMVFIGTLFATANLENPGLIPEVVVTAERYNPNETLMMPEVLVTAPRYNQQENGTMPTVEVTAPKPAPLTEIAMATKNDINFIDLPAYDDIVYESPTSYKLFRNQMLEVPVPLRSRFSEASEPNSPGSQFMFAKVKVNIERNKKRVGKLIIEQGDTVREDIEFTGTSGQIMGVLEGDLSVMGGAMEVTKTGKIIGDVVVLGSNLDNFGVIKRDIAIFGGNFNNQGIADGDIFVAGGTVKLGSGSSVNGSISIVGGSLERDTLTIVKGDIKTVEIKMLGKTLPKIGSMLKLSKGFPKALTLTTSAIIFLISLGGFFVITLLVVLIFPKPVEKIAEKTQVNIWIPIAIGFGIQLLIVPLIVLLAVSIIGIPIIPLFILAVFACLIIGLTSVYYLIGTRIKSTTDGKQGLIGKFALGFIVIMAIPILGALIRIISPVGGLFSVLGAVIIYVVATIGMGAAFYTLVTRKKQ